MFSSISMKKLYQKLIVQTTIVAVAGLLLFHIFFESPLTSFDI